MGRHTPCACAQIPVEAEGARRSKRGKERYGLQERRMLRSKPFSILWKEQDDYPGTEQSHSQ